MERRGEVKISLPEVCQLGVVVKDVDEAVKYYSTKFGLGPFKVTTVSRSGAIVHGKPVDYKVKLAFANIGKLQLELIQVLEGKTIQKEFLDEKGEGLHHLGFQVKDIEAEVAKWKKLGFKVLQRSKEPLFAYMDTDKVAGVIFELIQPSK
jgi:4-hydroxyphenylpyruvate dioxygenase-like putative hemolysin